MGHWPLMTLPGKRQNWERSELKNCEKIIINFIIKKLDGKSRPVFINEKGPYSRKASIQCSAHFAHRFIYFSATKFVFFYYLGKKYEIVAAFMWLKCVCVICHYLLCYLSFSKKKSERVDLRKKHRGNLIWNSCCSYYKQSIV